MSIAQPLSLFIALFYLTVALERHKHRTEVTYGGSPDQSNPGSQIHCIYVYEWNMEFGFLLAISKKYSNVQIWLISVLLWALCSLISLIVGHRIFYIFRIQKLIDSKLKERKIWFFSMELYCKKQRKDFLFLNVLWKALAAGSQNSCEVWVFSRGFTSYLH